MLHIIQLWLQRCPPPTRSLTRYTGCGAAPIGKARTEAFTLMLSRLVPGITWIKQACTGRVNEWDPPAHPSVPAANEWDPYAWSLLWPPSPPQPCLPPGRQARRYGLAPHIQAFPTTAWCAGAEQNPHPFTSHSRSHRRVDLEPELINDVNHLTHSRAQGIAGMRSAPHGSYDECGLRPCCPCVTAHGCRGTAHVRQAGARGQAGEGTSSCSTPTPRPAEILPAATFKALPESWGGSEIVPPPPGRRCSRHTASRRAASFLFGTGSAAHSSAVSGGLMVAGMKRWSSPWSSAKVASIVDGDTPHASATCTRAPATL